MIACICYLFVNVVCFGVTGCVGGGFGGFGFVVCLLGLVIAVRVSWLWWFDIVGLSVACVCYV